MAKNYIRQPQKSSDGFVPIRHRFWHSCIHVGISSIPAFGGSAHFVVNLSVGISGEWRVAIHRTRVARAPRKNH